MPESYAANTAALWIALGHTHTEVLHDSPELVVLSQPRLGLVRVVTRRPLRELPAAARAFLDAKAGLVDDPFGTLHPPGSTGVRTVRRPIMARPPMPVRRAPEKADLEFLRVTGPEELREAENVIVHGFPHLDLWPPVPGRLLPADALAVPGLRVWLVRRQRVPAAACCTYDDGATVGVHWLVTLPEQRGRGIARLLLSRALADRPDRGAVAAASPEGLAVGADLGFDKVSEARWHTWR
ncbi:GNAT family N-acetyltransferase [Thermobifida halotolerans]|uniref:GNAT family N-acetyltransferase n=1 Tax=Thermobifida halotolerans TaxID=483545 RepID=A0AA97M2Q8_9ACTN|nr:GNAT family N-acetyltransferase [Thermobifida halotolerans]UOE18398.1 GNAT family N-acetyltransferase [Thermobifida halotolerans]